MGKAGFCEVPVERRGPMIIDVSGHWPGAPGGMGKVMFWDTGRESPGDGKSGVLRSVGLLKFSVAFIKD